MNFPVTDCGVLSVDSAVIDCLKTGEDVPVLFVTIRVTGKLEPVIIADFEKTRSA